MYHKIPNLPESVERLRTVMTERKGTLYHVDQMFLDYLSREYDNPVGLRDSEQDYRIFLASKEVAPKPGVLNDVLWYLVDNTWLLERGEHAIEYCLAKYFAPSHICDTGLSYVLDDNRCHHASNCSRFLLLANIQALSAEAYESGVGPYFYNQKYTPQFPLIKKKISGAELLLRAMHIVSRFILQKDEGLRIISMIDLTRHNFKKMIQATEWGEREKETAIREFDERVAQIVKGASVFDPAPMVDLPAAIVAPQLIPPAPSTPPPKTSFLQSVKYLLMTEQWDPVAAASFNKDKKNPISSTLNSLADASLSPPQVSVPMPSIGFIGCANVGKTCLIEQFTKHRFIEKYNPTIRADYIYVDIDEQGAITSNPRCRLRIWDAPGKIMEDEKNNMYIRSLIALHAIVVVFDSSNRDSFKNTEKLVEKLNSANLGRKFILVGTHSENQQVTNDEISALATKLGCPYFLINVKYGMRIENIFKLIAKNVIPEVKPLPVARPLIDQTP